MTTNSATVTCLDQQIPSICVLHVQSMICGFTGSASAPVVLELKCMKSVLRTIYINFESNVCTSFIAF